jgi:uncharacterized protein VirK/YbjX
MSVMNCPLADDLVPPRALSFIRAPIGRATSRPAPARLTALVAGQLREGRWTEARRLAWRIARSPTSMGRWVGALDRISAACGLPTAPYDLVRKSRGKLLAAGLSVPDRFALIGSHYERLFDRFGPGLTGQILAREEIKLADLTGKSGAVYYVTLGRGMILAREGELGICLSEAATGRRLALLTVTAGVLAGSSSARLWIGALQGCAGAESREATVRVTRDLNGARPKDLLIEIAGSLCRALGLDGLMAVSNRQQFVRFSRKAGGRFADYDAYWAELGGTARPDGFFELPPARPRREAHEVPASKRKAWLARRALVETLDAAVRRLAVRG